MPTARETFWSLLVDFVADHADPEQASCHRSPGLCPMRDEFGLAANKLLETEDVNDLIDWLIDHVIREGNAIARTRRHDGGIGLTGFTFDSSRTSGMLAGALMTAKAHANSELEAAARTILQFGPPSIGRTVVIELLDQLVGTLVQRHQQMRGARADA